MNINVGHFQLECVCGDLNTNVKKIVDSLADADEKKMDIVSFPESFLTGFFSREEDARSNALSLNGNEISDLLKRTASVRATWMVGFNELRNGMLFNSVLIVENGRRLGIYRKAFPEPYFTPGREFPVFESKGVRFGVVICADGGYIEPSRILALKGARIIFSPHFNYIEAEHLINHFRAVRNDHIARAVENSVWFLRGNNVVVSGFCETVDYLGIGYGDSYLLNPSGEFVATSKRHCECFMSASIQMEKYDGSSDRSRISALSLGRFMDGDILDR